jgi:hypothetical protein
MLWEGEYDEDLVQTLLQQTDLNQIKQTNVVRKLILRNKMAIVRVTGRKSQSDKRMGAS